MFKLDASLHKDSGITEWQPASSDISFWECYPDGFPPTLFFCEWYKDYKQYPSGVADIAGYWAETQILGGVVVFDRHTESDAVYIHPSHYGITYRICRLLDEQKKALLDFLTLPGEGEATPPCPLPIHPDEQNLDRVDPEEPIAETGIYRDLWERKDLPLEGWDTRSRDVVQRIDWPTDADYDASQRRWRDRRLKADQLFMERGERDEKGSSNQ